MEFTAGFWVVITQGGIVTIAGFIFAIVMFVNFFKKKTMGTALLAFFYVSLFLNQLWSEIYNILSYVRPYTTAHKVSITIYMIFVQIIFVVLYQFASRHILRDNDVVRMIYTVYSIASIFSVVAMIGYELFTDVENPIFYYTTVQEGTGFQQILPTLMSSLIVYIPILILIQIRLVVTMGLKLRQQKGKDPIKRKGFLFITHSIFYLFVSTLLTILFVIDGLPGWLIITIYVARGITYLVSIYYSYVGWILPKWFRRRIRQQTWITKQLKKKKTEPTTRFVTSTTYFEETKFTEVADR